MPLLASEGHAQIAEDLKALFQTMDNLAPPGIWDKPLVSLKIGFGSSDSERRRSTYSEFGILVEQSEQRVAILNSKLQFLHLPIRSDEETNRMVDKLEIVSLPDQVRFFNETLNHDKVSFAFPIISSVFWARVAHARGESTLRDNLAETARALLKDYPLSHLTENILPNEEYLRIVRSFEDFSVTRERILEELVRLVQLFPDFSKTAEATQLRNDVKSLVDEDTKHTKIVDLEAFSVNERITELIYQLRNQEEGPLMRMRHHGATLEANTTHLMHDPCWKLYQLGFDAVPQLIEALSDSRPSRIVDYPRIYANTAQNLTIGQCAELILGQFVDDKPAFRNDSILSRQVAYREWYAEVERVGVKAHLMGVVEKGGTSVESQALLLARSYPEAALKSIPVGIGRTNPPGTRGDLYEVMSTLGEGAAEYLVDRLKKETDPWLQVRIARLISKTHADTAFEFVFKKFEVYRDLKVNKNSAFYQDGSYTSHLADLATFLAKSNRLEAMNILHDSIDSLPLSARLAIVNAFNNHTSKESPQSVLDAVEALLIHELFDTGRESSSLFDRSDWRVCDVAALALSKQMPDRYAMNLNQITHKLDLQRMNAINEYRSRRGLAVKELPVRRHIPQANEQKVLLLVRQFLHGGEPDRKAAESELLTLGLGVYSEIDKQIQSGSLNDAEQKLLHNLRYRISQIVSEIGFTRHEIEPGELIQNRLRKLEGKRLTAEVLADLVKDLSWMDFGEAQTLRVEFCNCEPSAGFTIDVSAVAGQRNFRVSGIAKMTFEVSLEDESLEQGGPMALEEFVETVTRALNDPMHAPVTLKILLERQ